jgi:hypothetical protein
MSAPSTPPSTQWTAAISAVRESLLALHKSLIDSERADHERRVGKRLTPGELLQLLTTDASFDWLHPFSQLIVAVDELTEREEPPSDRDAQAVRVEVEQLLESARFTGTRDRDANVAVEHGRTLAALERLPVTADDARAALADQRATWRGRRRTRRDTN